MISIFNYTDYRKYVFDLCEEKKRIASHFSFRSLAARSGINAGNFTKALQGKRNLTLASAIKLSDALKLTKREKEYFTSMLMYCDAKKHGDKKKFFEEMMSFKESTAKILDAQYYEFYEKWYYTAIREAIAFFPLHDNNMAELGKLIIPPILDKDVAKAIGLLLKLNLIEKTAGGNYSRTDAVISTGNSSKSLALNNFVIHTMDLAAQAINSGLDETNLSVVSLSLSQDDFKKVQDEVRTFRQKILHIAKNSESPNRIYQCSLQLFPLSKKYGKVQK